ncbi:MAG: pilus assembly protein TadB [Actinomycetota bacterium]
MNTLLMAALGAGVGLGLFLVLLGARGVRILPSVSSFFPSGTGSGMATAWAVGGLLVGLLVLSLTGWIGAAIGAAILIIGLPWFFGGSRAVGIEVERTQAIASWTEMIRDNLAGAAGLEQALQSTAAIAPTPIAREVRSFATRLESQPVADALVHLGTELDHPAADLVVVSLANASRMESRDLGPLLTRLSESIRADVRMRLRVEVGRSRIRTSSKIVLGVTMFTMGLIYFSSRELLAIYDTTEGQFWLLGVFGLFMGSLWLMNFYSHIDMPERFTARRVGSRIELGDGA